MQLALELEAIAVRNGSLRGNPWVVLALLCMAAFMVILDATIVIVALPTIEKSLSMTATGAQWVISAYVVAFGGLLLLGGRAADRLGRRRTFLIGIVTFGLASLVCGVADSSALLIGARVIQGVAAATMMPAALSLLMVTFEQGAARNKALGYWGAIAGIGGTAGSVAGGPITDWLSWRWIFFINVPISLFLVILICFILADDHGGEEQRSFDLGGALSVTAALVVLVYAVASASGASTLRTVAMLALAGGLIVVFVAIERRAADPLIPLNVFGSRILVGGNVVMLTIGMATFGGIGFNLTLYAQHLLGYSAVKFGLISSINAAASGTNSMIAQRSATRFGFRPVARMSALLLTAACLILVSTVSAVGSLVYIVVALLVFGTGLGAGTVAGSIAALSDVDQAHSGVASGINTAAFQVGGALGIAAIASAVSVGIGGRTGDAAMADGYRLGFEVAGAMVVIGLLAGLILLRPQSVRIGLS
jgi:EmrB/QacA subfamily drug resistance transporter